jgi:hypothetical protein
LHFSARARTVDLRGELAGGVGFTGKCGTGSDRCEGGEGEEGVLHDGTFQIVQHSFLAAFGAVLFFSIDRDVNVGAAL